jgi:hypothetical protein
MERVIARNAALCRGVAIATGDPHQRDIRRHVDHRAAARTDDLGMPTRHPRKVPNRSSRMTRQNLDRCLDHGVVLRRRAAGVVVQHVQCAELLHRRADRCLQARLVGHIGANGDRVVARECAVSSPAAAASISAIATRAFTREQDRGLHADTRASSR